MVNSITEMRLKMTIGTRAKGEGNGHIPIAGNRIYPFHYDPISLVVLYHLSKTRKNELDSKNKQICIILGGQSLRVGSL